MNNFFDIQRFAYITNYNSNTLVSGTEDDDTIRNSVDAVTINALGGHDNIYNAGNSVSIDGGTGNDSIYTGHNNYFGYGNNVTVNTGAGNDSICNHYGAYVKIDAAQVMIPLKITAPIPL